MSFLKSVKEKMERRAHPSELTISLTKSGFLSGVSKGPAFEVQWQQISGVSAYKLDLITTDEVRFVFFLANGTSVEVSEEQPGFEAMLVEAIQHMPSIKGWHSAIIKPAFARNETVLFQR